MEYMSFMNIESISEKENSKTEAQKYLELEKQFLESNERLESLLNSMPTGIVIIDYQTQEILDINPHGLSTFGCPPERLIGQKCTDYICPAEEGNCPIIHQKQNLDHSEREIITFDGRRIPVLKSVIKTELDGKEVLIECFIDIADKKRAEKEHLDKEKFKSIVEMAGAVCHEFNQPLQVITGYCDMLQDDFGLNTEGKEILNTMLEQIYRMGKLTRNLMSITRYKTKPYLDKEIVDIESSSDCP